MITTCIGDSIVRGYPFNTVDSWVGILGERMAAEDRYINAGVNGETSNEVCRRFRTDAEGADRVILSVGTNDFIFTDAGPESVFQNIRQMEKHAVTLGIQRRVLVAPLLTVPEQACRCWTEGTDYESVNEKLKALRRLLLGHRGDESGLLVLDLQQEYAEWCESDGKYCAYVDGIHPSKAGYRKIAEIIGAAVSEEAMDSDGW